MPHRRLIRLLRTDAPMGRLSRQRSAAAMWLYEYLATAGVTDAARCRAFRQMDKLLDRIRADFCRSCDSRKSR